MNETYRILRKLGKGGTSHVYLGYHNNLKKYIVIKKLKDDNAEQTLSQAEVDALKELRHQYLPQVYDYPKVYNPQTKRYDVYTVMDYVDGADLLAYMHSGYRFTEPQLKRYLRQIAEVLAYMHSRKRPVYHCDIKPDNIMIDREGNAILIDFNTAVAGNQNNILGLTLPYASPEQLSMARGMGENVVLDGRTDLYSLGATFYFLISGTFPSIDQQSKPLHTMGLDGYSYDFLMLIDRLMVYDREKRLKSAKKLLAAIDKLDSRYRAYFAARCASLLVSAAFVGFGLFLLICGYRLAPAEAYREQYTLAVSSVQRGDLERAEAGCMQILESEDMQDYLSRRTDETARLYHILGDVYYYQKSYGMAASCYTRAVELSGSCTEREQSAFIRDTAVAYAQYGDVGTAKAYLELAKDMHPTGVDLMLIDIVLAARTGEIQQCTEMVRQLFDRSTDPELCLRAALTAASVCTDSEEEIYWLQKAAAYDSGKTARRGLALAWAQKAQTATTEEARQEAQNLALELYSQLCADTYASTEDRINYSVVLRQAGRVREALQCLEMALQYEPESYRVLANMSALYYESGNDTDAGNCCIKALRLWRADTSSRKLPEGSEEIQNLMEISRRLGLEESE